MSNILLRAIFRRPINLHGAIRFSPSRFDSTVSVKQMSSGTSKATDRLSRAASVAGPALNNAVKGLSKTVGNIGGRTGQLVSFIQREFSLILILLEQSTKLAILHMAKLSFLSLLSGQIPSAIFYARVAAEFSKLVFHGQKMNPP